MAAPTPPQFYAAAHRGNRFGVTGPLYGPHGHLGQDFNGWPQGTVIPACVAGEVVSSGWSDNLGWFITVLSVVSNGAQQALRYISYCHMQSRGHALGHIGYGEAVGPIGATGKLANGVHVHIPVARSSTLGGTDVEDPLPYINHAIGLGTTTAGSGSTPIEEDDLTPDQATQLVTVTNAITDPTNGILKNVSATLSTVQDTQRAVITIANAITDPNIGLIKLVQNISVPAGADVDYKALASQVAAEVLAGIHLPTKIEGTLS